MYQKSTPGLSLSKLSFNKLKTIEISNIKLKFKYQKNNFISFINNFDIFIKINKLQLWFQKLTYTSHFPNKLWN